MSACGRSRHPSGLVSLKVFIRHVLVRDDSDPGPGKGDFDVTLGLYAGPPRIRIETGYGAGARDARRTAYRWRHWVWSGYTYDVRAELGPVSVIDEDGWLTIAGAGIALNPIVDDQVRGGLVMLGRERRFGMGHWWRTTNGRHFDIVFTTVPGDATAAACPPWTGDVLDAPCPIAPTEAEYRAVLPAGFDRRAMPGGAQAYPAPAPELKHTYVPASSLMACGTFSRRRVHTAGDAM